MIQIYHNSRCSKSRQCLSLIENSGKKFEVIKYLENPPTISELTNLISKLGIVEHKNNATTELISDYKQMYEYGYLRNWGLFFSIVLAGYTISKVFTNNTSIIKQ